MFADDDFETETLNQFGIEGEGRGAPNARSGHILLHSAVYWCSLGLRALLCLGADSATEICLLSSFVDSSQ